MSISLKISGVNAVLSDLDQYSEDVQKLVMAEVRDWAERTEADAKRDVPVDTGALKGSIRSVLGANGLTWIVKVGGINGVNYAPFVIWGTGTEVDLPNIQAMGLVEYARQFMGASQDRVHIPANDFFFKNARIELTKTVANIKKLIAAASK